MKTRNFFLGVVLVVAVTLFLRLPYVLLIPVLCVDEAYIAAAAMVINSGGTLFVDVIDTKPPMLSYLYALVFRLFGANNLLVVQLLGVAWTLLTTAVLYQIARLLGGGRAGFAAAIFYAVCSTTFNPLMMAAAKYELFMVLPLALSAFFFIKGLRDRQRRDYFTAGLFCGAGFLFKHSGVASLGAMLLFLILAARAEGTTIKEAGKRSSLVLAGFLGPVAAVLVYFYFRGALRELYFWGWVYGWRYTAQVPFREGAWTALAMIKNLVTPNFAFWILALASISSLRRSKLRTGYAFCWLWGLFSLAAAFAGKRPWHHYYAQVIPPFAVLAGLGAAAALDPGSLPGKRHWWRISLKAAIAVFLAAAVFITHRLQPQARGWMSRPEYRGFYDFKKVEHPGQKLADHIRQNSSESDSIYVWGVIPEYYFLSGRRPASRFILPDLIVGVTPGGTASRPIHIPRVIERLLEDLESSQPVYFIDTSMCVTDGDFADHPVARYPLLWKYLHTHYEIESVIDRNLIYRKREGEPEGTEPLFPGDEARKTILDATRALEIDPEFAQAYFFRGQAYYRLGQNRLALDDFNRALDLLPSRNIFFHRGLAYSRLGEREAAGKDFNTAFSPH